MIQNSLQRDEEGAEGGGALGKHEKESPSRLKKIIKIFAKSYDFCIKTDLHG